MSLKGSHKGFVCQERLTCRYRTDDFLVIRA